MLRLFSVAAGLIVLHPSWLHAVAEPYQLAQLPARVDVRAFGGDLSFCYGTGSICAIGNDLFDECEALMEDYTNLDPWYQCEMMLLWRNIRSTSSTDASNRHVQ